MFAGARSRSACDASAIRALWRDHQHSAVRLERARRVDPRRGVLELGSGRELYPGEVGSSYGVQLGDQLVVTPGGCHALCPFPVSAPLLA